MAASRAVLSKGKPGAWGWGWGWGWARANQLVKGKSIVSGVSGSSDSSPNVVGLKNHRLLPVSFNLACRHCFSHHTTSPPLVKIAAADFNYQFSAVPCANDDKWALYAAEYALEIYNDYVGLYEDYEHHRARLVTVVRASAIRFGWSIYSVTMEGIDEKGDLHVYYALVLQDSLKQMKKLLKCGRVDDVFPYPSWKSSYLDSKDNSGIIDFCKPWEPKNDVHSPTVASDTIVPVDPEDNKEIHNYALSAVKKRSSYEDNKICLKEVCVRANQRLTVGSFTFLLVRARDDNKDSKTYCAIIKVLQFEEQLIKFCVVDELF